MITLRDVFNIVLVAVTYYMFSDQFFKFSSKIFDQKVSFRKHFFMFIIIYIWFVTASILELPLIINWLVFLLMLGIEIRFVFSLDLLVSYALSMFCAIMGLAINIFFRSLISILMNIPLNAFDKAIGYIKTYPIVLGFMSMVVFFFVLRYFNFVTKLKQLLETYKSLVFYAWIEIFIYLFLIIQLLIYTQSDNSLGIKLWGIKSALFSLVVLVVTNIYSLRVASLHYYMDKQHEMHNHLIKEKKDINKLWKLAYSDVLTGCGNRQLLIKRLKEYAGYGGEITLAFIDVNSLKIINDQYGHVEGDHYLVTIADVLLTNIKNRNLDIFRYGGDEFIMISNTLGIDEVDEFLKQINIILENNHTEYRKSISYGIVRGESLDYQKLIHDADELMYQYKHQHYIDTMRILNS